MEPADGALLLLRRVGRLRPDQPLDDAPANDRDQATTLAKELGGLPLALDQAGAFVEEAGVSLAEYLDLYRQRGQTLRAKRGGTNLDHPHVTETFTLAFEQVAKTNPAAVELLRACAFLHPDAIPEALLIEGALEWSEPLATALADPLERAELFATLNRFSLLARDPDAHTLSLHRVVQAVLQDELDEDGQRHWAERAVRAVNRSFPNPEEFSAWPQCERLLPQAQAASAWIERWDFAFAEEVGLLHRVAHYLHQRGRYAEEGSFLQRSLVILQHTFGPEHPDTLGVRHNIADWTGQTGNVARALELCQALLPDVERVLGSEHPNTLITRDNIAHWMGQTGDAARALELLQALLPVRIRVLGSEHPDTLNTRHNIAFWTGQTGDEARALELFQALLPDVGRVLGSEHPNTLITRHNIAFLIGQTGDAAWALELFQALLPDIEQVLGPEHPETLKIRDNIADWTWLTGNAARALELFQALLPDMERVVGAEHPDITNSLNKLALLYHDQGRYAKAEPLFQRALAIWKRTEHPNLAAGMENYAVLLEQTGRAAEAARLRKRAQAIRAHHNPRQSFHKLKSPK